MRKLLLLLSFVFIAVSSFAQPKTLSLEDAILQQRSTLAPKRMSGLQWVSNTHELSYFSEDRKTVIREPLQSRKAPTQIQLTTINQALDLELEQFPMINWTSANRFYFVHKKIYYEYDLTGKTGKMLLERPMFAEHTDYHQASNQLAYTKEHNLYITSGKSEEMAVTSEKDPNIVSGQAIARFEFGIRKGTFWSPQGTYLAFYQKDETNVSDYTLLDLEVTPAADKKVKYPMAGQGSESARVGVYDTGKKEMRYLDVSGPKDQYLTNLAWGPNEQYLYIAVVNRAQNRMWLNKYEAATGAFVKTLFEESHDKYVEPETPVWFLANQPDQFLWMSERNGYMHVYHYDTNGNLLGQKTSGNWVVEEILGFSNSGKNLIVAGTDESGLNRYAYSVSFKNGKTKKLSKKSGIHRYSMTDDGVFLIDTYSSVKIPGVTNIINTRGKTVNTLLSSPDPLSDYQISRPELLTLKAADGSDLHARMIKPSNFDPKKKYPVLVYVYGGPHAQMVSNRWMAGAPLWMYYMAEKGYVVFTLDNRGSKSRGFAFENVIHRQVGTVEVKDQMVGVKHLRSLPYVDSDRMAVHGWSYGGFMTISMMLREPDAFKVGVAGGPVTDWKYYEVMYGERYMDRPDENPDGYAQARLKTYAKNLKGDLMMIHGTVDDVVVMQHSLSLIKTFVDEGILVDFFPYPMHPHNVRGKDRVHLMRKVLTYVEEKLAKHKKAEKKELKQKKVVRKK